MATYKLHSVGAPKTAPIEYYPAGATIVVGDLLKLSSGSLVVATGNGDETYVAVGNATSGKQCPAIRILDDMIFEDNNGNRAYLK